MCLETQPFVILKTVLFVYNCPMWVVRSVTCIALLNDLPATFASHISPTDTLRYQAEKLFNKTQQKNVEMFKSY